MDKEIRRGGTHAGSSENRVALVIKTNTPAGCEINIKDPLKLKCDTSGWVGVKKRADKQGVNRRSILRRAPNCFGVWPVAAF